MKTRRPLTLALTGVLLLLTAACSVQPATRDGSTAPGVPAGPSELGPPGAGLSRVILLGDSVALGQSLAIGAAFAASDVEFHSMASAGGGTVVGPVSAELWQTLPDRISSAKPSTVIYQITSYDWGTEQEQRDAYERLLHTVTSIGARLVFVTMPPIEPDDFYTPHLDDLDRAPQVARRVAEAAVGQAVVLDAGEVWGETYQRTRGQAPDRSSDGIHTCPQGAARFTSWLLAELTELYPEFTAPAPEKWANTGWAADDRFIGC